MRLAGLGCMIIGLLATITSHYLGGLVTVVFGLVLAVLGDAWDC